MVAPWLSGPLASYRPIPAASVAAAMVYANSDLPPGVIESDQIEQLAAGG